ncbi:YtjB family periplasmic protein [Vibrio caribbeanicus]|jgi:membrane protein|uniref:YtjB family periplasmic protein n=1 Tax=Vibrio caribbeanicus TaxID=701175 RepID=UPI002283B41F|nr:YtjB family periplasmic protein [Vibrio caribbeanicus]MCY9844401.1 YtjB family periplasmic protein [Vibrio caribbeanicus]|tara:strand:- start:413 stop:1024 length:612 start_codon:yes stop_codon:yes gene_type:complete
MNTSLFSFRTVIKGIVALSLVGVAITIAINSVKITQGNEQIQVNQLETLTNMLVSQASLSAGDMIVNQDQERLLKLTNQLAQDDLVTDATIYDVEGVKLAASDTAVSVREILGLDTPLQTARIGKQQLVEPVFHDGSVIGFIRVTFETGKLTAFSDHYYRKSDRYMYTMIALSFLAGGLIALMFRRHQYQTKGENLLLKKLEE